MTADTRAVFDIIQAADGRLIGKTRLQKTAYILELAGLGAGFKFSYYHYGPYSSDLVHSVEDAETEGLIQEREEVAQWGGTYSVFTCEDRPTQKPPKIFREIVQITSRADAIDLELAATAAYLKREGFAKPWDEVKRRKPEKATQARITGAQELWKKLSKVAAPLPAL